MNRYLRDDLKLYEPYHAPAKPYAIKLDANENPFEPSPLVQEALQQFINEKDNLTRYPDTDMIQLREAIASRYAVRMEEVTCGVGSDQLIDFIIKAFVHPKDVVLYPNPSFSMYGLTAKINHAIPKTFELRDDFTYDIDALIKMIQEEPIRVLFLCTPNNPTGTILPKEDIYRILNYADFPVIVDEAYGDFMEETMIDDISRFPQLIVLRTFSKSFGLAGLRCGYAIGQESIIEDLNRVKSPYNLSSYSQVAARAVLEDEVYYQDKINLLKHERERVARALETYPWVERVYPSAANFLLIRCRHSAVLKLLEKQKILVRDYPPTGRLKDCIRLTVGSPQENDRVLDLLQQEG